MESHVQQRQNAHGHTCGTGREHGVFQPLFLGQQGNGGQGNGHLQHGGGLRPAVVLVHLRITFVVPIRGFGLQLLGTRLDLVLFLFVAVDLLCSKRRPQPGTS